MKTELSYCLECSGWGEWIGYKKEIGMQGYVCCHVCKGTGKVDTGKVEVEGPHLTNGRSAVLDTVKYP